MGYSPDGRFLVVTTKLSSDAYDVFTLSGDGALSANATVTTSNTVLPFAFNFDAQGRLVGVEAATSTLSVYTINPDGSLSATGSVSDGGAALCWVSTAKGYFFGSNAASATVSSFAETPACRRCSTPSAAATHPGTTDSAASPDGKFLYVQSGGVGALDVFAVSSNGALSPVETAVEPAGRLRGHRRQLVAVVPVGPSGPAGAFLQCLVVFAAPAALEHPQHPATLRTLTRFPRFVEDVARY